MNPADPRNTPPENTGQNGSPPLKNAVENASDSAIFQAYADGELSVLKGAEMKALESRLANDPAAAARLAQEREFNALVKKCAARIEPPADLQSRLRAKLAAERAREAQTAQGVQPRVISRKLISRRWFALAAAVALVASGGIYWRFFTECPYMLACAGQYDNIKRGKNLALSGKSLTPAEISSFIAVKASVAGFNLPVPDGGKLLPDGAGVAEFSSISLYGAPKGAFARYAGGNGENCEGFTVLFVHNWPGETPRNMNLVTHEGAQYWSTVHQNVAIASWVENGVIYSLTTDAHNGTRDEALALAAELRHKLKAKIVAFCN